MANSHKRDANARQLNRRKPRAAMVAAPLALMATVGAVSLGVLASDPVVDTVVARTTTSGTPVERDVAPVTRSTSRTSALDSAVKIPNAMSKKAILKAVKNADERVWTTDELNIWAEPGAKCRAAR